MNVRISAVGLWPLRVAWLVMPLLCGPVFAAAYEDASRPVQAVGSAGLWLVWAVTLVGTLVPRTITLTLLRIVAPAAGMAVIAAVAAASGEALGWRLAALVSGLVVVLMAFLPETAQAFLDGSSYGAERRFALRIPGPLLLGLVEAVWAVVVVGAVAGPLLLAARQWVVGGVALVAGWAAVGWGARVLHTLSRRWMVLVPAGVVLHDQLALADPVLLRRSDVVGFGPAPADSSALDLTRGALGLALEVQLKDTVTLGVVGQRRGAAAVTTVDTDRFLFTPTRPGALLRQTEAARRTPVR